MVSVINRKDYTMSKNNKNNKLDKLYHVLILALASVLMFAGVMSLIQADQVVKIATASVIVFLIVKELYTRA